MTETKTRTRWRITLDQVCYLCRCRPPDLDHWAELGAFGPRLQEPRERGWHSNINRTTAQRAVIMSALLKAGFREDLAAMIAVRHEKGDLSPLVVENTSTGVRTVIKRDKLNLP